MNLYFVIAIIIISLIYCLALSYGIRIGKAMQKDIPPVPLAEPVRKVAEGVKRNGKRMVKLIKDINETKVAKKQRAEKEETGIFD